MNASPLDALRNLFGDQLEELAGGVVSGEFPLTTDVVNRLIARKLAGSQAPITAAQVETHETEAFTVHLRPKGPLPPLNVDVHIDHQPQLPSRPTLGMRWTLRGLGPLAMLASPVIAHFRALPPSIRLERDRLWVDVYALLQEQGLGELVPFLTGVRVITRERRFVIQFELRASPPKSGRPGSVPA